MDEPALGDGRGLPTLVEQPEDRLAQVRLDRPNRGRRVRAAERATPGRSRW